MGEYFNIVNITKKEYINPGKLNSGVKLWEISANSTGILAYMLANDWKGDKIALTGDYQDSKLYEKSFVEFEDVSGKYIRYFNDFIADKRYQIPASIDQPIFYNKHKITVKAETTLGMYTKKIQNNIKPYYYNKTDENKQDTYRKKKWECKCGKQFKEEEKAVKHLEKALITEKL